MYLLCACVASPDARFVTLFRMGLLLGTGILGLGM